MAVEEEEVEEGLVEVERISRGRQLAARHRARPIAWRVRAALLLNGIRRLEASTPTPTSCPQPALGSHHIIASMAEATINDCLNDRSADVC